MGVVKRKGRKEDNYMYNYKHETMRLSLIFHNQIMRGEMVAYIGMV